MAKDDVGLEITMAGIIIAGSIMATGDRINDRIAELQPSYEPVVENVMGEAAPETYYEVNGERVFLEIDGVPVQEYFR